MSYTIKKIALDSLTQENKEQYKILIPPRFRCCLEGKDPDDISFSKIIAIGLEFEGNPVGIAVSGLYEGLGLVEIFSFQIQKQHQNVDLGKEMMQKIESEGIRQEAAIITYHFRNSDPNFSFIQKVLKNKDWIKPKLFVIRYFFDCYTFNPPWYDHPPKLPRSYKLFPWKDLKKTERVQLEQEYNQGHFSDSISPFQKENTIEYTNSLGLRYKNEVIGWSITHTIATDTVKYTALYVKPQFQFLGYPIRLLVESIKLQQKSSKKWSLFEINLEDVEPSWLKFVQKRLAPYALRTDETYQSWKALRSDTFKL